MGGRLWLNMTDAQINAVSGLTTVQRIIAKTIAHYGIYVMDSAGANAWSVHRAAASAPTSEANAWSTVQSSMLGGSNTWLPDNWPSTIYSNFKWLDPCVAQLTC